MKGKAEEVEEKEQSAYNEETGEINWDCPVSVLPLDILARADLSRNHTNANTRRFIVPRRYGSRSVWSPIPSRLLLLRLL